MQITNRKRAAQKFQDRYTVTNITTWTYHELLGRMQAMMQRELYPEQVLYRFEDAIENWTNAIRRQMLFNGTRALIVTAKDSPTVVGCALYNILPDGPLLEDKKIHLRGMYVIPEHRKPGPAIMMLHQAHQIGIEAGCSTMEYTIDLNVDGSHRNSYENLGGKPVTLTCSGTISKEDI